MNRMLLENAVKEFLDSRNFHYEYKAKKHLFEMMNGLPGAFAHCVSKVMCMDDSIISIAIIPLKVPENKRAEVAELICRINYSMKFGHFDLDFCDGEIHYDFTHCCEEHIPGKEEIASVCMIPSAMVARHSEMFAQVMFADKSAQEAYNKNEDDIGSLLREVHRLRKKLEEELGEEIDIEELITHPAEENKPE